jgi:hypothetical protein
MRRVIDRIVIAGTVFLLMASFPGVALASSEEPIDAALDGRTTRAKPPETVMESSRKEAALQASPAIPIWSDSSGGRSSGGGFDLGASLGQPVVGRTAEGTDAITAGFLAAAGNTDASLIFADGFETGDSIRWSATTGSGL